ncbi:MAG: uracil-DNA glycosylase [Phycisphaerales bacterium]|jgi:DNA polymerase|nr:uracil-DNA glycosylase [Phycisphaerales bacterium]
MDIQTANLHLQTSILMGVDFLPVSTISKPTDKQSLLDLLKQEHDSTCPHCTTASGFTQTVFGIGEPNASLMFIGEAPGAEEDAQGIPFVGAAGQKLNQIIEAIGLQREDVYIANILKSRPPNNRTPLPTEIDNCGPFLIKQIEIVEPSVIVSLGSPATKYLLSTNDGITRLRGNWGEFKDIPVMPTYHPAYLLRNYTKEVRQQVWSDVQQVIARLKE